MILSANILNEQKNVCSLHSEILYLKALKDVAVRLKL